MGRLQTLETRAKISASLKKLKLALPLRECKTCHDDFQLRRTRQIFCSQGCATRWRNINGQARLAGLASVAKQSASRRSKNEILFAELCAAKFQILTNESMFDGWDADVIIPSLKIAVLWNGAWHYKQISRKCSLTQIQTRDKIKLQAIIRNGYTPVVIKDMGKHNEVFVLEQFEKFVAEWSRSSSSAS